MKITHVISDGNVGGAGILLASLTEKLKNDFDIEVILPEGSLLAPRLPCGIKVTALPFSSKSSFTSRDASLFKEHFKKNGTDVIHTHATLSARIGGRLAGIEHCISTRHCAYPSAKIKKLSLPKRLLYEASTDLTVSTADFATQNLLRSGLKKEKIVTIKNGSFDLTRSDSSPDSESIEKLGIPKGRRIIGSVARLEKIKGQDIILRSAKEVLKFFPDTHFVFVGCGSLENEYKSFAARLGIDKNVTFTGYLTSPKELQKSFYINVNASRGTETSSLATSECMSLSIPTVASAFGGNTEMIKHRENGLIFNTDNVFSLTAAILELLEDDELHATLSRGARMSFEKDFSVDVMANRYKNLYYSL